MYRGHRSKYRILEHRIARKGFSKSPVKQFHFIVEEMVTSVSLETVLHIFSCWFLSEVGCSSLRNNKPQNEREKIDKGLNLVK